MLLPAGEDLRDGLTCISRILFIISFSLPEVNYKYAASFERYPFRGIHQSSKKIYRGRGPLLDPDVRF